jgi:hypothetical protein
MSRPPEDESISRQTGEDVILIVAEGDPALR